MNFHRCQSTRVPSSAIWPCSAILSDTLVSKPSSSWTSGVILVSSWAPAIRYSSSRTVSSRKCSISSLRITHKWPASSKGRVWKIYRPKSIMLRLCWWRSYSWWPSVILIETCSISNMINWTSLPSASLSWGSSMPFLRSIGMSEEMSSRLVLRRSATFTIPASSSLFAVKRRNSSRVRKQLETSLPRRSERTSD